MRRDMNQPGKNLSRRDLLRFSVASPFAVALIPLASAGQDVSVTRLTQKIFFNAASRVVPVAPETAIAALKLDRRWNGQLCTATLTNTGTAPVRVKEVVLFEIPHALPPETRLYG